jgi:hypothetical protein
MSLGQRDDFAGDVPAKAITDFNMGDDSGVGEAAMDQFALPAVVSWRAVFKSFCCVDHSTPGRSNSSLSTAY